MLKKVLASIIAATMISTAAFAGPAPRSIEANFQEISKKTGTPIEEVRREGVEALRRAGAEKYSADELRRIERGEPVEFDAVRRNEAISLIKNDSTFKARTGLAAVRNDSISRTGGDAFDAMRETRSADRATETKKQPTQDQVTATELKKLEGIRTKLGLDVVEALKSIDNGSAYVRARRIADKLGERVAKGEIAKDKAASLMKNAIASRKALGGKLPLGKGAEGACAGMEAKAIENLGDWIERGASEGKDEVTYTQAMAKAAADMFHQDYETSLKRVCATADQNGCGILGEVIAEACGKMMPAAAL